MNKFHAALLVCSFCVLLLTACGGPSDEKVTQAQQKYIELTEKHNEVVDAHEGVSDTSLDQPLAALKDKVSLIAQYNLQEMNDEEIDLVIQTMDTLIASYNDYLQALTDIKNAEDEAVLIPVPVTLMNGTELSFSSLLLYEQDNIETHTNILESLSVFAPGQTLTGMLVQKDADQTPWIFSLTDTENQTYEIILSVEEYDESGVSLHLRYDGEIKELFVE